MHSIAPLVLLGLIAPQETIRVAPAPRKQAPVKTASSAESALDWVRFAKLTIHDPGPLAADPRVASVLSDLRALIRTTGEDGRQFDTFLEAFRQGKPWPLEIHGFAVPGSTRRLLMPIFYDGKA